MPVSDDLLKPIPGANPSGENLRYASIYDKIKEARREEEETPQGEWVHERKKADYTTVLRLCTDALTHKSKDLQLSSWMTEALLKKDGLAGLQEGLELQCKLIESFWETLYPEIEDADAELRAAPLEWLGGKFADQIRRLPLTNDGLNTLSYNDSRAVGYEADAASNEAKQRLREAAISDGKITAEDFDKSLTATPKLFYRQQIEQADSCTVALETLEHCCESRFGEFRPSFFRLKEALEEFRQNLSVLLRKKLEQEPDVLPDEAPAEATPAEQVQEETARTPARVAATAVHVSKEPQDVSDAVERVGVAASYLRRERPYSPMSYLLLRALRWGELRENVGSVDLAQLEAPSTEIRKELRRFFQNCDWEGLLEANEKAMAMPCGRGWLDLQRYAAKAAEALGDSYSPVCAAIISGVKALLADYPQLSQITLNDETPTASLDTQAWLLELLPKPGESQPEPREMPAHIPVNGNRSSEPEAETIDAYELALQAAGSGRAQEGIEILEREAAQERSGRGRFQRKMQLAEICMKAGHTAVALPILESLAAEIDQRKLEEWEDPEVVIHTLGLLYRCLAKLNRSPEQKENVYRRICRLGPARALDLAS
jgi:type VI secretion system protein ImpA